jgi:hypothetical protein
VIHSTPSRVIPASETNSPTPPECLKSLRYDGFESRFKIIASPIAKTFNWVWEPGTGFSQWLDEDRGLFWIQGKPGSGKSTLLKEMFAQSQRSCKTQNSIFASFFFSNNGSPFEKSVNGLLRSLLLRILRHNDTFLSIILSHYEDKLGDRLSEDDMIDWDRQTLEGIFAAIAEGGPSSFRVCFFIDALDECSDASVKTLLLFFERVTDKANSLPVKICFTSRHLPYNVMFSSPRYPGFVLEDKTQSDIALYIKQKLRSLDLPSSGKFEEEELQHEVIRRYVRYCTYEIYNLAESKLGLMAPFCGSILSSQCSSGTVTMEIVCPSFSIA